MALRQPLLLLLLLLLHHLDPSLLQSLEVILVHGLQFLHLCIHLVFHQLGGGCENPQKVILRNPYLGCLHELLAEEGPHLLHLTCHCQVLARVCKSLMDLLAYEVDTRGGQIG